jgi:hypothetical protein
MLLLGAVGGSEWVNKSLGSGIMGGRKLTFHFLGKYKKLPSAAPDRDHCESIDARAG